MCNVTGGSFFILWLRMDDDAFAALVAELQADFFADDLDPPAGAERWSADDLRQFYESGGDWRPPPPPPPPVPAVPLRWDSASVEEPIGARTVAGAHGSSAGQGLTRVRFVVDPHNEVAAPRVLSGSWDATAKLWRLPGKDAEDALPVMDCLLHDPSSQRWVYDTVPFWHGQRLGVATAHTGGMAGEPDQVLRLWELSRTTSGGPSDVAWNARTSYHLNTQGSVDSIGHRRGVHAIDANASGAHLASISDDLLVLWAIEATGESSSVRSRDGIG